jgi:hypothetical protein
MRIILIALFLFNLRLINKLNLIHSFTVVNAYYNALENSIEFPAGILQGSFFSKDKPKY